VRAWLDTQDARLAAGEQRLTLDDPVIETFARIPPAHWHELLASLERCMGNWKATAVTRHALVRSAQPEHREPVLAAFARYPFLVEAISRCGWIAEAAPTMRALLTEKGAAQCGYGDTARIIAALASLRDAQDHALFADALARMKYGYWQAAIARSLATIPDFDLEAAVRGAWRHFGRAQYMDLQDGFAVAAARAGIAEALPVAMLHALGGRETKWSSELLQEEARVFLWEHFALKVDLDDPAATSAWWETARDRVRWDAQAHRWHGPPPPPAKPVARPPPVGAGTNEF
jgi:hypothetical protein